MNNTCSNSSNDCIIREKDSCEESAECIHCGSLNNTQYVANPYLSEIYGDDTEHLYCADCYRALSDEI